MAASLRKQLVDRRRVVHGIASGREQVEHSGHPLDDTGAIVGIHMIPNATTDGINAGNISAHNDRCKPV